MVNEELCKYKCHRYPIPLFLIRQRILDKRIIAQQRLLPPQSLAPAIRPAFMLLRLSSAVVRKGDCHPPPAVTRCPTRLPMFGKVQPLLDCRCALAIKTFDGRLLCIKQFLHWNHLSSKIIFSLNRLTRQLPKR